MTTKKPTKCTTPKRDRYEYSLTSRDLKNLLSLVNEANEILSYYVNMPENKTGELGTTRCDELEKLSEAIDELKDTIDNVNWR